ncbi:matrixin family metalloprotease [Streptomyces lanatus]|uniref:Matrixin family metalloprotease n=1 Tax=Streptomyces lanatus TaxID=66900 RepID=A0ABV1Y756_9ACTN|nr:matrixin family metalloprotease [Streptomyces lanatus]GHH29899.1 hypothetical protein GCM10018780_88560 [Streptomyces lanatus]
MFARHGHTTGGTRRGRATLRALAVVCVLAATGALSTAAHAAGSVDGDELRYEDNTKYDGELQHAADAWNEVGDINVAPDDFWNNQDVDVYDVDRDVSWDGRWIDDWFGDDDIELNSRYLDGYDSFDRNGVVTHEFGHALGLDHIDGQGAVMESVTTSRLTDVPAQADIDAYNAIYSRSGGSSAERSTPSSDGPRMHAGMVTDFADDAKLAGFADDVFVGTVVAEQGRRTISGLPETQYSVRVDKSFKGDTAGTTTVNQQGGRLDGAAEPLLFEGDQLLRPGRTYLFATTDEAAFGWQTLVPVYGDRQLNADGSAVPDAVGERWSDAVRDQVRFSGR